MADIQAAGAFIDLATKGTVIILMIIAASLAIKKKNNICLAVVIIGNLLVYYVTLSPLFCWIVSIACIIWAASVKSAEPASQTKSSSKSSTDSANNKKPKKIGTIIGLIIGIGLVAGPLIGYMRQEASLNDPTTQGVLILCAVIGAFMVINNLFKLFEGGTSTVTTTTITTASVKAASKEKAETGKIRCRFCKKLYSSEYNGCPYCKKK